MGLKEAIENERKELQSVKRPYETVAFIIFAVLVFQQLFFLVKNFIDFLNNGFFSTTFMVNANLQNFVTRIVTIDSSKWLFVILGIAAWVLYYFALYLLVWNYSRKHNLAKWTWTLFVAFGPTIFLAPAYIWFVIYAYRFYLVRFAKRVVSEFKSFDPNHKFAEEEEEPKEVSVQPAEE